MTISKKFRIGLFLLAVCVLLPTIGAIVYAQEAEGKKIIRANEFILEDADGNIRAKLTMGEGGPMILLVDAAGKVRASLILIAQGPSLGLFDSNGELRAVLAVAERPGSSTSALILYDARGNATRATPAAWQK